MQIYFILNIVVVLVLLIGLSFLIYHFDRKVDQRYFQLMKVSRHTAHFVFNYGQLEAFSLSYLIAVWLDKDFVIAFFKLTDLLSDWLSRQLVIALILYIIIEIIGAIILFRLRKKDQQTP